MNRQKINCCINLLERKIIYPKISQFLFKTEVAAKGDLGIADSLYNVQLVCDFCEQHIPGSLALTLNDLFYTHNQLRFCLLAFVAELFNKFEVHRLPIARDSSKPYRIVHPGCKLLICGFDIFQEYNFSR